MSPSSLPQGVKRQTNNHGREFIHIDRPGFSAQLSIEGAHLLSHTAKGKALLWQSQTEPCKPGIPLRGGIPICWPWFGADRPGPAHGIARTSLWALEAIEEIDQALLMRLSLPRAEQAKHLPTDEQWQLDVEFRLGQCLQVSLISRNVGNGPQPLTQALHSYLPVSDIQQISLTGLEDCLYLDQLTGLQARQQGDLLITAELDRIYADTAADIHVRDPGGSGLLIQRSGSNSVVVWNPWQAKAKRLSHFPEQAYQQMLCVEAANTLSDARVLEPGESHILTTRISHLVAK